MSRGLVSNNRLAARNKCSLKTRFAAKEKKSLIADGSEAGDAEFCPFFFFFFSRGRRFISIRRGDVSAFFAGDE